MTNQQPFTVQWLLQPNVIYAHLDRQLQAPESEQINDLLVQMIQSGVYPVYLLMDLRDVTEMKSPRVARVTDKSNYKHQPNLQWFIAITNDPLMSFLASTSSQMADLDYRYYPDLDEAVTFLQYHFQDNWYQANLSVFSQYA